MARRTSGLHQSRADRGFALFSQGALWPVPRAAPCAKSASNHRCAEANTGVVRPPVPLALCFYSRTTFRFSKYRVGKDGGRLSGGPGGLSNKSVWLDVRSRISFFEGF